MLASIHSASLLGVEGRPVEVEVHVSNGFPGYTVVGLPDTSCRESRDRVRAALLSSSCSWPTRRVTVNLAPSGTRKSGAGLDLPIAIGLLVASEEIPARYVRDIGFIGELGLDGSIRRIPGTISLVDAVCAQTVVVSPQSVAEAEVVPDREIHGVETLAELVAILRKLRQWPRAAATSSTSRSGPSATSGSSATSGPSATGFSAAGTLRRAQIPNLDAVKGQRLGRRAIEIAAAGGHHFLMVGPPGCGKTMLARTIPGLLPHLDRSAAIDVARIRSAAGLCTDGEIVDLIPPFRAPHHSASAVSLVGGGHAWMRPGEISLAHRGVLFLDEMGEFQVAVIEALRQPLEEGVIRISRANGSVSFPADFLLVAAMNPCPCGEGGAPGGCRCSPTAIARYARRLSGPMLDRFDLRVPLMRPSPNELLNKEKSESSERVAQRIAHVRVVAIERSGGTNSMIPAEDLDRIAPLTRRAEAILERKLSSGSLSARGLIRIRRVARTIADLENASGVIEELHVAEACELRSGLGVLAPEMAA